MITIANSGGANLKSIEFALKRIGADYKFCESPEELKRAKKILLPGVGTAKKAMETLISNGTAEVLRNTDVPVLGICLGMQLLYESSEEGNVDCLGVIPGKVVKIKDSGLPIPHMGWNKLISTDKNSVDCLINKNVYFVHSYRAEMGPFVKLYAEYGEKIPAFVQYKNYIGAQFHPEKSAEIGEIILERFSRL